MDYEQLEKGYWLNQVSRVQSFRAKIAARERVVVEGRVLPEEEDLSIGTGRRLSMAILFIDLCGSSSRPCESLEEQDLLVRAYDLFFGEMVRIAEEYGGEVEKNTGDGLMAYFEEQGGNPTAEPCKRALSCALTMLYTNLNLITPIISATPNLDPLRFRVGIDYGPVTISQLGSSKRFTSLVAVGNTANVASKMLDCAEENEIIVGENVFRRLPLHWQKWCVVHKLDTGYLFASTKTPYRFFKYTSRWTPNHG